MCYLLKRRKLTYSVYNSHTGSVYITVEGKTIRISDHPSKRLLRYNLRTDIKHKFHVKGNYFVYPAIKYGEVFGRLVIDLYKDKRRKCGIQRRKMY